MRVFAARRVGSPCPADLCDDVGFGTVSVVNGSYRFFSSQTQSFEFSSKIVDAVVRHRLMLIFDFGTSCRIKVSLKLVNILISQ